MWLENLSNQYKLCVFQLQTLKWNELSEIISFALHLCYKFYVQVLDFLTYVYMALGFSFAAKFLIVFIKGALQKSQIIILSVVI